MTRPERGFHGLMRRVAMIAALAGAVGSVGFTLRAGHRQKSGLLMGIFVIWVLSPFIVLVSAWVASERWPALTRATLYGVMLVISLATLAIYGVVALGPARAKTAAAFVVVPPASWLLVAVVVPAAALLSRRLARGK